MTVIAEANLQVRRAPSAQGRPAEVRVALLGLGQVGSAVARLAQRVPDGCVRTLRIAGALVRNPDTHRHHDLPHITTDGRVLLDSRPDVVVEVLGGLEPARSLLLEALARRIPVVTANKSLLAAHGDELLDAADRARVPLRYEASVLAGVPFLGTFARRPYAAAITQISAIVNGTTNYVLSRMQGERLDAPTALRAAQESGFAEADPSKDLDGLDAAEKLVVLVRQFARRSLPLAGFETAGIRAITRADLDAAHEFGGAIKPVVFADWLDRPVAFAGPAFVPAHHPLGTLDGVANGICLGAPGDRQLFLCGPGAGPEATATTILDDVLETQSGDRPAAWHGRARSELWRAPATGWLVRVRARNQLPAGSDLADLLGAYDIWIRRTSATRASDGLNVRWLLTYPCARERLTAAIDAVSVGAGCQVHAIRCLGDEVD